MLRKMHELSEAWLNPKVEIGPSPIHGQGMFATTRVAEGETVVVWGGPLVGKEEADRARAEGKVVMQLEDDLYSVEERGEDPTYFMNHSCDPNVWMAGVVSLVARRDIESGEELTVDYALFEACEGFVGTWECVCGSIGCRGRVTGRDWRMPELRRRYAGHFLPLIGRRIEGLEECTGGLES